MNKFVARAVAQAKLAAKTILRWLWIVNSQWGPAVSLPGEGKVTVILLAYHAERMPNIQPLIRSALKCALVEQVLVSNNNPRLRIRDWVRLENPRVRLIDQPVDRSGGYRWTLAQSVPSEYLLAIDDDVLLFPWQMARLIKQLIARPEVLHGLAGQRPAGYVQNRETEVDNIFQVYAVTRQHVKIYHECLQAIRVLNPAAADSVEFLGEDLVISRAGTDRPVIHSIGFILRSSTAGQSGVALSTRSDFQIRREAIAACLKQLGLINQ
jgi:hypothetical protein